MKAHIEIDILDDRWPMLKLVVNRGGVVRTEGPIRYDIAASQFEPAVKDTLRFAVEAVIQQRKRGG